LGRELTEQPGERSRRGRGGIAGDDHGKSDASDDGQHEKYADGRLRTDLAGQEMSQKIAGQDRALEKHHAGVPNRRRSAEGRERHARQHRLHREEQHRARPHRQAKERGHEWHWNSRAQRKPTPARGAMDLLLEVGDMRAVLAFETHRV
jgi:hypothetical protein